MSIAVIIPAYKAKKFLPDCLASIGAQTLKPEEIIVVDDCSPEPVDEIISDFAARDGFPSLRLIKHEVNRGQAAARNTGARESSSSWLAFLDSDDQWAPDHLQSLSQVASDSGADLIFCPAVLFTSDPHAPDNYCLRPLTADEESMRPLSFLNRCFIITSSTLIRRESLEAVGGFDEGAELRGVEDLDCFLRLLKQGAEFRMSDRATLYYRKHPDSATGRLAYLCKQDMEAKRRHIGWVEGSWKEKQTIMTDSYWRAAIQFWLAKSSCRYSWWLRAFFHSLWNPLRCLRWNYRFVRAWYRHSSAGL